MTAATSQVVAPAPTVVTPDVMERLDRIDAQLAAIATMIGPQTSLTDTVPDTAANVQPAPEEPVAVAAADRRHHRVQRGQEIRTG